MVVKDSVWFRDLINSSDQIIGKAAKQHDPLCLPRQTSELENILLHTTSHSNMAQQITQKKQQGKFRFGEN